MASLLKFGKFDAEPDEDSQQDDSYESESAPPVKSTGKKAGRRRLAVKKNPKKKSNSGASASKDKTESRRGNGKIMKYSTWRATPDARLDSLTQTSLVWVCVGAGPCICLVPSPCPCLMLP